LVEISVIMATARSNYPIIGLPNIHVLQPTMHSLEKQAFKDFELIIVDALYPLKREWIERRKWSFPVKYVPVHPNHRFWLDRKRWNVCGALNTGILYAEGELLVRVDDCSEFKPDFLAKFWEGYKSGYFPLAMHIRYLAGKPAKINKEYFEKGYEAKNSNTFEQIDRKELLKRLYGEEGLVRDTRYPIVKRYGKMIAPHNWGYGYTSFSLEAALKINGFDELFDGDKSLEDVDFFSRLYMAGYKNMRLLDVNLQVIEHEHEPIPKEIIDRNVKPIKCNYAIYLLNRKKNRWRANCEKLTDEDVEFIREESLKPPCSPYPNYYQDNCKGEFFNLWVKSQNIFDLKEERLNIEL